MRRLLPFLLSLLAGGAFAHPGNHRHDSPLDLLNHLLAQPDHLPLLVLALTTGVVLLSLVRDEDLLSSLRDADDPR